MNDNLEYNGQAESGSESMLKAMQDQEATYREEDLSSNLDWIEASGKIYQMNNNGEKFSGDHRALAKYGIDQMSEFNYNVALGMIPDVLAVEKADHETQIAFSYLMDTYDKKDITLNGFGRAVKELALDPTTYLGISTLGAGFAAKKGAQELAKEGLKNRLHNSIRNYLTSGLAVGATEGAMYSAGDTTAREMIQTDAGLREGVSGTDVAISGAIGAGVGAGLGKGIEVAGKAIGKGIDYINREGEQAMAQVAGGGVPNTMLALHDQKQLDDFIIRIDRADRTKIDDITKRYTVKPSKPSKLFRGVEAEGYERKGGGASEGYGLYTTANKSLAKDYGKVVDMNPETDIPSNPLAFKDYNDFEVWQQQIMYNTLGFKRKSEFGNISLNEIFNIVYPENDGIQIGKGNSSFFVKYPKFEDLKKENIK